MNKNETINESESKIIIDNDKSDEDIIESKYDFNDIPEFSCEYCGIHNINCIAMCKICKVWYCNKDEKIGSHIIWHLVKSKHFSIELHKSNKLGSIDIECVFCQNNNLFVLGLASFLNKKNKKEYLICCKSTICNKKESMKKINILEDSWNSFISNKCISKVLLQKPNDIEIKRSRDTRIDIITAFENHKLDYKDKEPISYNEFLINNNKKILPRVKLTYKNGKNYFNIFSELLEYESFFDRKIKERIQIVNPKIKITFNHNKYTIIMKLENEDVGQNLVYNEIHLKFLDSNKITIWENKGYIENFTPHGELLIRINPNKENGEFNHPPKTWGNPSILSNNYTKDGKLECKIIWNETVHKRLMRGLQNFSFRSEYTSKTIFDIILGKEFPKDMKLIQINETTEVPNLPKLNEYQCKAVKECLKRPLSLIRGPPGTGKTITTAVLVYFLNDTKSKFNSKDQILVCAPSNIVCEHIASVIAKTGINVIHLTSKGKEGVIGSEGYTLKEKVDQKLNHKLFVSHNDIFEKIESGERLKGEDLQKYNKVYEEIENEILKNCEVIVSTCVTSGDYRLRNHRFVHVIIDEATQGTEPETLLPITKGCKQVILIGDDMQLGPVVCCKEVAKSGYNQSLFERLLKLGITPFELKYQYRMNPILSNFSSDLFYNGTLLNGISKIDRKLPDYYNWYFPEPNIFWHTESKEQLYENGVSYYNEVEALCVEKIVDYFISKNVPSKSLAVITPYRGQNRFIQKILYKNERYLDIEVNPIDSYQGREKDIVIISTVRSNDQNNIGFLSNEKRLNVALTRSKYGLIIIGNTITLSKHELWKNLLYYYSKKNSIYEGSNFSNLKNSNLKFEKTDLNYNDQSKFIKEFNNNNNSQNFELSMLNNSKNVSLMMNEKLRHSTFKFEFIPLQKDFIQDKDLKNNNEMLFKKSQNFKRNFN